MIGRNKLLRRLVGKVVHVSTDSRKGLADGLLRYSVGNSGENAGYFVKDLHIPGSAIRRVSTWENPNSNTKGLIFVSSAYELEAQR